MKKILGYVLGALLFLFPLFVSAAETIDISKYATKGLEATLAEEGMEKAYSSYKENDNQAIIYMFRGNGCGYCRSFLTFLNSITDEYGKYFKLVSFEVWNDSANSELMTTISTYMGEAASGVPYVIIGDQVFPGYASTYDDSIKAAIKDLYNKSKEDRYDVFAAYNKDITDKEKSEASAVSKPIIWNLIFVSIATIVIVCYINSSKREVMSAIRSQRKYGIPMNKKPHRRDE